MKTHFYLLLFLFNLGLYAQGSPPNFTDCGTSTQGNLIINGDFEELSNIGNLPNTSSELNLACRWIDNALGTPDYFHRNSSAVNYYTIPNNLFAIQEVNPEFGGDAYAGFGVSPVQTEVISIKLKSPLQPNSDYILSFDVSMADYRGEIPEGNLNPMMIQAFLSSNFISVDGDIGQLPIQSSTNPILVQNDQFSSNSNGWDRINLPISSGQGGQEYLYIGGISNPVFQDPNSISTPTYYFIDNATLRRGKIECIKERIAVTCNNSDNADIFNICGTFTTDFAQDYQLELTVNGVNSSNPFGDFFILNHDSFIIPEDEIEINDDGTISGAYCIEINSADLENNVDYNFKVTLRSNSSSCYENTPTTSLFNLEPCTQEPAPCEDVSMTITNVNQLTTNCLDLQDYYSRQIRVSINLPSGYGVNELQSDWLDDEGVNNFYLNIIDENNEDSPVLTETQISGVDVNEINNDGIFNYYYQLQPLENMVLMADTTYRFEVIANIGDCEIMKSVTTNTCVEALEPCDYLGMDWDYLDNLPDCNIFENGDTYQICGTFSALDGFDYGMSLRIGNIDNPSNSFSIPITPDPNSISISEGVVTGSYCVDLLASDFNPNDSYTINKSIGYDSVWWCITQPYDIDMPLDDCVEPTDCQDNPELISLLEEHLKKIINALLPDGFTSTTNTGWGELPEYMEEITYMPEVQSFMGDYELQTRVQNAIEIANYPPIYYDVDIQKVYYMWIYMGANHPPRLKLFFSNGDIEDPDAPKFFYQFGYGYNNGIPISNGLNPNEISEITNIDIIPSSNGLTFGTYTYLDLEGNQHIVNDFLLAGVHVSGNPKYAMPICWYHDLNYEVLNMSKSRTTNSQWGSLYEIKESLKDIKLDKDDLLLFPNPAKDNLIISSKNKLVSIELFDVYGNLVKSTKPINDFKKGINIKGLAKGYYVVKAIFADGTSQFKNLIKE